MFASVFQPDPQSVLKFKLTCKGPSGSEEAFLPVTVYVQDVNDHAPEFQNTPYHLEVDEVSTECVEHSLQNRCRYITLSNRNETERLNAKLVKSSVPWKLKFPALYNQLESRASV